MSFRNLQSAICNLQFPNLLSLLIIALMAANYFGPFADLDFAWQVRTGERIVQTGLLQPPEAFSYTIAGSHVPDFEWLYEVILYLVWNGFGFGGLKFLRVLVVMVPLVLLVQRLRREGIRAHAITIAIVVAVFVLAPAWNLRPMYCTTIGLLLVAGWLHDHCSGRKQLPWSLPLVMLLWGNLHPGVIAGQGMLLGAITWEWLNSWVKLNKPLSRPALSRLSLIAGSGLAATLICPGPLERLLYPFRAELRHPIQRIFMEMQPLYTFLTQPPYGVVLAYVVGALVLLTIVLRFRQYRIWEIAVLGGLALLANFAYRSLQDWLLMMLSLGVPHMAALLAQVGRFENTRQAGVRLLPRRQNGAAHALLRLDQSARKLLGTGWIRFQPLWPALGAASLLIVSLIPPLARDMPFRHGDAWPVAAVTHIEHAGLKGRFFAPPDYGSFLIWRLPGAAITYTDTRGFFFPPELIEDSHYVPQLGPDWQRRLTRILDKYRTDYFFLETWGARGAFWRLIEHRVGPPLYKDSQAVLLTAAQIRHALDSGALASTIKY